MSQPDPIPNDLPSMHDAAIHFISMNVEGASWNQNLINMLEERKQRGLETYGTLLQPFNGRDALQDALEELLDALVYIQQGIHEAKGKAPHRILDEVAELERIFKWTLAMCSATSRVMVLRKRTG